MLNATLLKAGAAVLALSVSAASAQTFRLPPNYISRFSNTELAASNDTGFGIRYFPLPFADDYRVSIVKHPNYLEYNIGVRKNDTTFAFGVYNNDGGGYYAPIGTPKLEVTHDPYKGLQFSAVIQHLDPILPVKSYDPFSKFTAGYAFTVFGDRLRVLNEVGLGYKSITDDTTYAVTQNIFAPYTHSEVGGGYSRPLGDKASVRIGGAARFYYFPLQGQSQASIDLVPGFETRPFPGFSLDLSHLERYATSGAIPIGDLSFGRYEESYATASYRFQGTPAYGLGMLRTRLTKNWIGNSGNTYLYGDVLFRVDFLPALVGPSFGYRWSPSGNVFLISLAAAPK